MIKHSKSGIADVLFVGQTPPPYHGQAIMAERLANAEMRTVRLHHVRMAFSKDMDQVGRFELGKVFHLFSVIFQIYRMKWKHAMNTIYYPPSGPNLVPICRDIVILLSTRWMFKHTVFHMHAAGISEYIPKLNPVLRWLCRLAYFHPSAVFRLSEFTPDDAAGLRAEREIIVPGCADDELSRFQQTEARHPVPTLLYLGTVCEEKGILDLFKACEKAKQQGAKFYLDVVGSFQPASFEDTVARTITELGLSDQVTLHGQIIGDDKFRMLASSDVFCFPSFYSNEAFPCVIIEAMSFCLPVLSTQWRGIASIVDNGVTGFLTEIHDTDQLAHHLLELCSSEDLRKQMGAAGRRRFENLFTTDKHVELVETSLAGISMTA